MRFIDVHTHGNQSDAGAIRIYNLIPGEKLPESFFSVGIHPWYADKYKIDQVGQIIEANPKKCIAIGECGLDLVRSPLSQFEQEELLHAHFQLAQIYKKPVILHLVRASHIIGRIIKEYPDVSCIWHGFTGKIDILHQYKNNNMYFSFSLSAKNEYVWEHIDEERIFCETDDRNEAISKVYEKLATIRNTDANLLKKQIYLNLKNIFGDGLAR